MLFKNGRISWPIFLAIVYSTLVIVGTDLAWRLFAGPVAIFGICGAVAAVMGNAAIFIFGRRRA